MTKSRIAIGLTLAMILAACGGGDSNGGNNNGGYGPQEPAGAESGSVRGTVRDNQDASVPNASVVLSASGKTTRNAVSQSDGSFSFTSVATGVWQVAVTPAPTGFTGAPTTNVTVTANQEVVAPALVLTRVVEQAPMDLTVVMSGTTFVPAIATIARGGRVTWRNNDFITHNATGTGGIDSGNMNNGATYERIFATAGTFNYSCTLHPGMNGQVVVQP